VGAGWIAQEAFMPGVAQTGNSSMTAIVSGTAKNAARLAEFYGVEHVFSYEQYDQMLASDVADAVYVALPNSMHAAYAVRALRAGKHALVEKPLATTEAECEAMIAAAKESGAYLMTAYRLHNEPGTVDLLERIRNGEIGDPRIFSAVFSFMASPDNHRLKPAYWGGPLQDIGVYCLNAARHIFAAEPIEAVAVKSFAKGSAGVGEVEETIAVTLSFPEGRLAQFIASFGADNSDFYHVAGTAGSITANPGFRFETAVRLTVRHGDIATEKVSPQTDHFAGQTAYFSDCIVNAQPPEPDGGEGLADVRALLAIERAANTGQPQKIETPARQVRPTVDMIRILPTTGRRLRL
jgi:predicted dehydrogenase